MLLVEDDSVDAMTNPQPKAGAKYAADKVGGMRLRSAAGGRNERELTVLDIDHIIA